MMKNRFIVLILVVLFAGYCASAETADDEWVPVPLEEIERATLRRPEPATQSAEPEVLPEAETQPAASETPHEKRDTTGDIPADTQPHAESVKSPKRNRLTPEEIARRLRSNAAAPVITPRGARPARKIDPSIAKEGQAVFGRIGRIQKIEYSDTYKVTFENNRNLPYQSPRRLLPCRLLEKLETHLKTNPDARYRISGETTRDTKHVYLLLHRVAIVDEGVTDVESDAPPTDAPATQPATRPSDDATTDLIAKMLRDRSGRAVKIAPSPRRKADENVESVAPAGRTPFHPGKRDLVVDRIVRIIRDPDSNWWEARFESDNTLREPPLRILPGLRLVWIRMMMDESGKTDMRLRVSGDVTYYRGKRYLMLRKVLRQRDLDTF